MDIRAEEKKLYDEYKRKLSKIKKVQKENDAVGQVFTKGLLPIYLLYILSLGPTNGNDIAKQIGKRTKGLWIPSTGGIYPQLKKLEKNGFIIGSWDDPEKKFQKIYTLTEEGFAEFDTKKSLLESKIQEALRVFTIIYNDLY
ncbi:PadR family transcriptional regulator [uncultured Clostridium sp.]|jgi:DNA-binding PadR family transcriptional regulator|uniref:PadR family transcriptional regulator n=1 Tax=uncultured Clostridium sp. TaxID=59620 RepID=UPI0026152470|nr:PadR family transcriptional regulator [uncultured Clostridium sp.]